MRDCVGLLVFETKSSCMAIHALCSCCPGTLHFTSGFIDWFAEPKATGGSLSSPAARIGSIFLSENFGCKPLFLRRFFGSKPFASVQWCSCTYLMTVASKLLQMFLGIVWLGGPLPPQNLNIFEHRTHASAKRQKVWK